MIEGLDDQPECVAFLDECVPDWRGYRVYSLHVTTGAIALMDEHEIPISVTYPAKPIPRFLLYGLEST